jgi:predicted NBD/HSP70 family sugar kinase
VVAPLGIAQITFFVIDEEGIIRWRSRVHSNRDPNDLPPIDELLDAIQLAR